MVGQVHQIEQENALTAVVDDPAAAGERDLALAKYSMVGLLGEIEEIVGTEAAMKIAFAYGGSRVDIPADPPSDHWLIECIGEPLARRLCKELRVIDADGHQQGMRHIVLPLGPASTFDHLKQAFLAALKLGVPVRKAAHRIGITDRTAWRWRKKFIQIGLLTPVPRLTIKSQGKPRVGRKDHHKSAALGKLQAGMTNMEVAVRIGVGVGTISLWRRQFIAEGLLKQPERHALPSKYKSDNQQQFEAMVERGIAINRAAKVCGIKLSVARIWLGQMRREWERGADATATADTGTST